MVESTCLDEPVLFGCLSEKCACYLGENCHPGLETWALTLTRKMTTRELFLHMCLNFLVCKMEIRGTFLYQWATLKVLKHRI